MKQQRATYLQADLTKVEEAFESAMVVINNQKAVIDQNTRGDGRALGGELGGTNMGNSFRLVGGQVLADAHNKNECLNEYCTIHNFSDHHMIAWPQNWRPDRHSMERICSHGIGHPDPDDITDDRIHGCDGCCAVPKLSEQGNK